MTRLGWTVALSIVGILMIVGIFILWRAHPAAAPLQSQQATSTQPVNLATLSIYTSGDYAFSLFYPSGARLTDAYSTTTLNGIAWRTDAIGTGTPVVRIQQGNEELRVGVSTDSGGVKVCTKAGAAETAVGTYTVGDTTWQKFTFQKLGTDNERMVTSYRIVHAKACYALEVFSPLAGTATSTGYTVGDTITSFSFVN